MFDILKLLGCPDDAGHLLIEYPGFGDAEGQPSVAGINEAAEAAFVELARKLKVEPATLERDLRVYGISLGSGPALDFAVRHKVRCIVLVEPFTSLKSMARRIVGWPMNLLLRENFDNVRRLSQLSKSASRPEVFLFHGAKDDLIPVQMSRELAARFPFIHYAEHPTATHFNLPWLTGAEVGKAMRE